MPKKYRRYCNHCDNYYEGWGAKYCSTKCSLNDNRKIITSKVIAENKKRKRPLAERFWEKVEIGEIDECWEWQANKLPKGYGTFKDEMLKINLAHRMAYFLKNGDFDRNLVICHSCDNPPCVNPNHLFLGTQKDNLEDSVQKGRFPKGEKHHNSLISDEKKEYILKMISEGKKLIEIANQLEIPYHTVTNIKYRSFVYDESRNRKDV